MSRMSERLANSALIRAGGRSGGASPTASPPCGSRPSAMVPWMPPGARPPSARDVGFADPRELDAAGPLEELALFPDEPRGVRSRCSGARSQAVLAGPTVQRRLSERAH